MSKIMPITMPKWGIEMQEGTINGWHAVAGQVLGKNDPLLDVETEKIVNTVESPVAGTLRRIVGEVGDTLPVGALVGVYADADISEAELDTVIANFKGANASFEPEDNGATAAAAPSAAPLDDGEQRVSPIARRVADKLGVDVTLVKGTGRNGRVSKEDVEAFHASSQAGSAPSPSAAVAAPVAVAASAPTAANPATANPATHEKMSPMRLTIARRLSESKQTIPHYRLSTAVDFTALFARRAQLVAGGAKVSVNDLLLRGVALTLAHHPQLNAHYAGDEIIRFARADLCVAVSTAGGLSTPVVRDAANQTAAEIAATVAALAERARSGKLTREEITGGTFTVSNLGMFGIDGFDAIINPPQVAILAVGAARERVIARQGAAVVAKVATLTVSCDHRVVDGAVGAAFLAALRDLLEAPAAL